MILLPTVRLPHGYCFPQAFVRRRTDARDSLRQRIGAAQTAFCSSRASIMGDRRALPCLYPVLGISRSVTPRAIRAPGQSARSASSSPATIPTQGKQSPGCSGYADVSPLRASDSHTQHQEYSFGSGLSAWCAPSMLKPLWFHFRPPVKMPRSSAFSCRAAKRAGGAIAGWLRRWRTRSICRPLPGRAARCIGCARAG